jgi:hypothetical protein
MPSLEEGFGIPILESALVRLPIFCADLHPLRSLAGPYASYFSPQEDPSRVAKMIFESLATDPYYQLRQDVRRLYTWEAIYHSRLLPLLEERS